MRVVFVVGPTGIGKSELAFRWAKSIDGHIINADSVQCFQSLNIGSNKPSKRLQEKVPHHLFDVVEEEGEFTAGDFRRTALRKLKEISDQEVPYAFVVGGSGFYLQALLKGMPQLPIASMEERKKVIKNFEEYGLNVLYEELKNRDPAYAGKVHHKDVYRILRAIEILRTQPQTITQTMKNFQPCFFPYPNIMIGLRCDRKQLRERVYVRTCQMLELGLIDEVQVLVQKGLKDWPVLKSVGYKQVMLFLEGQIKREDLLEEIVFATMKLAKKQMTWFKNKYAPYWIDVNNVSQYYDISKVWELTNQIIDNKEL